MIVVNLMFVSLPGLSWAGAGGEKADKLYHKVDLTNLTGLNYWFAKWYNDNLWLYAVIVTLLMGVIGLIIAVVTDVILKMTGKEVSKLGHHE
jgi:hypothetical protein